MRVLVTRPVAEAERTARAVTALGHEAVLAPVMAVERLETVLPHAAFDATIAASARALACAPALPGLLKRAALFAVGDHTARAARAAGFSDVRIGAGDADALAALVVLTQARPAHLLHLAGRDRKPVLERELHAAGFMVTVLETYAARPLPAWPPAAAKALAEGTVDAVLHFSNRSARLALALATAGGLAAPFANARHLCLSQDCAEPLRRFGAGQVAVAARPEEGSLLALLDAAIPPRP